MTLPTSGPISLTDIQTEFGGSNPINLSEYYKGGAYVTETDYAPNVPRAGPISLSNFYGAANTSLYTYTYTSNRTITLPATFVSPIIVSALGGGGGSGGSDSVYQGYPGYAGKIVTGNVAANSGDTVNIYIGGGGGGGVSGQPIAAPGAGGASNNGYYGGTGGASGGSGSSGAGGGGGAATTLSINSTVRLVAAGGGGGGGAGFRFSQEGKPNNNNPGTAGTIYGGTGENKSGDGGGAGGGGAGLNGGVGGLTYGGDSGAYSGENGDNLVPADGSVSTGSNGGPSSSTPGTGGSVTISYYA